MLDDILAGNHKRQCTGSCQEPLSLRRNVTHGGKHGDAAVLDLGLAAAREVLGVAIRGEASRVEEANRRLHYTYYYTVMYTCLYIYIYIYTHVDITISTEAVHVERGRPAPARRARSRTL